jgi:hypothetical protein
VQSRQLLKNNSYQTLALLRHIRASTRERRTPLRLRGDIDQVVPQRFQRRSDHAVDGQHDVRTRRIVLDPTADSTRTRPPFHHDLPGRIVARGLARGSPRQGSTCTSVYRSVPFGPSRRSGPDIVQAFLVRAGQSRLFDAADSATFGQQPHHADGAADERDDSH